MREIRLIPLLLALLLLTGCGKVGQAQEAIDAIGTVTMESGDSIRHAEALVAALSQSKQEKLSNLRELTEARTEYDRLTAAVDKATKAILNIGTVSPSSADAIREAREAYEALEKDGLTEYAASHYPILAAAESQYTYLCTKELYEKALRLYEQGNFSEAMSTLKELTQQYPDSDFAGSALELDLKCLIGTAEVLYQQNRYDDALQVLDSALEQYPQEAPRTSAKRIGAQCYVAQAQDLYRQGDAEGALLKLEAAVDPYRSEIEAAGGTALQNQIDAELDKLRPDNAKVLENRGYVVGGYCQFTVKADQKYDALVKLERIDDPAKYVLFYVRAGQEVTINVQPGTYYAKYTSGQRWFGEEAKFGRFAPYTQADDLMEFSVSYQGAYVYYSTITITLYTTAGGNMTTSPISGSEF